MVSNMFIFSSLFGKMIQFDYIIFFGWIETTNQKRWGTWAAGSFFLNLDDWMTVSMMDDADGIIVE